MPPGACGYMPHRRRPSARSRRRWHRFWHAIPGLLLEDKGLTLALHYRLAPHLAAYAHRLMCRLADEADAGLEVQFGKRVAEVKPSGIDKGTAVAEYLAESPFKGRRPVFIGDDLNDEHGFAEVNRLDGISIKVGKGNSCARFRLPDVAAVRRWLGDALKGKHMRTLDLALIGNCTIGALVDARANIIWGCFPRFDGDPVFCSLLKETDDYGFFAVELADCERTEQHYLENTAILVTRLYDRHGGAVEVTDFAPRFGQYGRMFRPMMLVRRVRRLCRQPAHHPAPAPGLRRRRRPARRHLGQQPHPLCGADAHAAADHRCLAHRDPAGNAVLSRGHRDAAARRGRNRARSRRRGRPPLSRGNRAVLARVGALSSPSPTNGRRR